MRLNEPMRWIETCWKGETKELAEQKRKKALMEDETLILVCERTTFESNSSATVWQPIETAPKDGTRIDVWLSKSRRRVTNCYWGRPSHTCGENEGYCDSCPDRDGWVDGEDFMNGYTDEEPTHWMPLPTPPQA